MNKINLIALLSMLLSAGVAQAEEQEPMPVTLAEVSTDLPTESKDLAASMEDALAPYRDGLINTNNHYKHVKLHRQIHGDGNPYTQTNEDDARINAEKSYNALQNAVKAERDKAVLAANVAANNNNSKIDLDAAKAELEATQTAQAIAAMQRLCGKVGYAVDDVNINNNTEVADATKTCKIKLSEQQEQAKLVKQNALTAKKNKIDQQQTELGKQQADAISKKDEIAAIAADKATERANFLTHNPKRKNPAFYN